jgi:hypothetical protein
MVHAGPGIKQDHVSKINNAKRANGVAQVVYLLPSNWRILSSTAVLQKQINKQSNR